MYGLNSSTYDMFETTKFIERLAVTVPLCFTPSLSGSGSKGRSVSGLVLRLYYHSAKSISFATKMGLGHLRNKEFKIEHSCRTAITTMCEQRHAEHVDTLQRPCHSADSAV